LVIVHSIKVKFNKIRMRRNTIVVATLAIATIGTTAQSCVALATSTVGLAVLKQILIGGITKGLNIFNDKDSFLANQLIEAALPKQLKDINTTLEKAGLKNLVAMEKQYIAQAAAFTVETSRPILINAVNSLTSEDAARIVQGGSGAATKILRERTSSQLIAAITPKVEEKLNEYGIVRSLNSALSGSNLLGSIFGNQSNSNFATGQLSQLASEQLVNGLFNIIENHEQQNSTTILNSLNAAKY
jgi:hypothetical protein